MDKNPETNVAPEATPPAAAPAPSQPGAPGSRNNKKTALIASIVGGVVAIGVIVLVLMLTVFAGPSKADYKKAYDVMQKVRSGYTQSGSEMSTLASGMLRGNVSDSAKQEFTDEFNNYKNAVGELKDLKALKDKDVKQAYDAFTTKNDKFVTYAEGLVASMDSLAETADNCKQSKFSGAISSNDPDTILSQFKRAAQPCFDAINKLKGSKNQMIANYAQEMDNSYKKMVNVLEQMVAAAKAQDGAKARSLYSELSSIASDATRKANSFSSDFREEVQKVDVKDELNDLGKIVTDKANQ